MVELCAVICYPALKNRVPDKPKCNLGNAASKCEKCWFEMRNYTSPDERCVSKCPPSTYLKDNVCHPCNSACHYG